MSIGERIATAEGKRRYARVLFATIADRYDLITGLLSYGQDRCWKRRLVGLIGKRGDSLIALDLATGTGDIAFLLCQREIRTVGLDVTHRMIVLATAKRNSSSDPAFLVGDMAALPFPSASFDVVTTGYGLRNAPELAAALDEIFRVLKPGGAMLSLDFNRPSNVFVRAAYLSYLSVVGGLLGWLLHGDPDTYRYIPASIRRYPGARAVAALMQARGFSRATCYPLLGGLMAIHHAEK